MQCILVCWGGTYQNVQYVHEKKHYLCLWFTGGIYEWECYFGCEMLHIAEAYTSSGTVDEWVPADAENMHDHTGAKYGCHSKVDGHPQF